MRRNSIIGILLVGIALVLIGVLNPAHYHFPRCPFLMLTGFKCPGCGSQRAIHHLMHGQVFQAAKLNLLFLPGVTYAGAGYLLSALSPSSWPGIQKKWYGQKAAYISLVIILVFWIGRNIL